MVIVYTVSAVLSNMVMHREATMTGKTPELIDNGK